MVDPPPAAPLVVSQAKVLLQRLVIELNAPGLMGSADQLADWCFLRQRRQDVLAGLGVVGRPLDKQPLSHARRLQEAQALEYVAGYCICNNVSEQEWQI